MPQQRFSWLWRQLFRRKRLLRHFILDLFPIMLVLIFFYLCIASFYLPPIVDDIDISASTPFDHLIPSNRFELYWTMWNTPQSTFRGRQLLVLESIFIHHPQATVIMLSPTLNDAQLFLPFRHRGYRIFLFNVSLQHILEWNWYSNNRTEDFLQHWNSSNPYFYRHIIDYLRTIALYLYGGTYLDIDALILQPLPNEEFIGYAQIDRDDQCEWCIGNESKVYLAPGIVRFQPHRKVLRHILEETFDRRVYNPYCLDCVGSKSYTQYILEYRDNNDSDVMNLKLFEPYRLYPYIWADASTIFYRAEQDTTLELADLMKRSYSLHLFGRVSDRLVIVRNSLMDRLFHQYDLGDLRPKIVNHNQSNNDIRLICPSIYVYTRRKQGRFIGRDVIYLRLNQTFSHEHARWNIAMHVSNGKIILPRKTSLSNLNQAQINRILNELKYEPFELTSFDTLMIDVKGENVSINCFLKILIFSQWVTILTKTMGTTDRWSVLQGLAASIERYFPQTKLFIGSDSGKPIDKPLFLEFISSENNNEFDLTKTVFVYDLPEDCGLSKSRNYLINITTTPFFFIFDDDFELEEDSHLDILLEVIYTHQHIDIIAGKVPEDIEIYHDYAGTYLQYNETLELVHIVPDYQKHQILYPRPFNEALDSTNPCRQVDFVPNVFMGRTESVRSVLWDDYLKLGEHEDFFLRFRRANRTVYTCDYIKVHHLQIPWWLRVQDPYYAKRSRVFQYYKDMLRKHHLKRLINFGIRGVDLDVNP